MRRPGGGRVRRGVVGDEVGRGERPGKGGEVSEKVGGGINSESGIAPWEWGEK